MTYVDGLPVELGDRVSLDGGQGFLGVVVAVIGEAYSPELSKDEWSYLQGGILVETMEAGLIHFPSMTSEIVLVEKPNR